MSVVNISNLVVQVNNQIALHAIPHTSVETPSTPDGGDNLNDHELKSVHVKHLPTHCIKSRLLLYILCLIIGSTLFIVSLLLMHDSTTTDWFKWTQGEASKNGIISLVFHTILQPIGYIIIIASLNGILTHVNFVTDTKYLLLNLFYSLLFFTGSILILFLWNGNIYFTFDINTLPIFPRCLISLWTFILLITISILCLLNATRKIYQIKNWTCKSTCNMSSIFAAGFMLVYLPLCFIFCTFTGHSWHSYPGNYFPRDFVKWVNTQSTDKWTFNILVSEYDLSDNSYAIENGLTGEVYMKIFPDVLMYYSWLELICIFALISYYIPSIRKILSRRVFLFQTSTKKFGLVDVKLYPTIADCLFIFSLIIFLIIWFYYWFNIHLYRQIINNEWREIVARTFGITANLFASLLILPITRNSSFNKILGISSRCVLHYHMYCGYIWFICTFLHMVFFINYWDVNGMNKMLPFTMDTPQVYIPNNYTIPQMWYIYLFVIIPVFGVLTFPKLRRINFELFYYIHIAGAWITISAMFWHCASFIYFMLPVAGMYFFDRCIQFINSSRIVTVKEINVFEKDIIKLSCIINNDIIKDNMNEIFGGYYFVKISNISAFEWHPFSVFAYNKMDNNQTNLIFYIRVSGDFTKQLYAYAVHYDNFVYNNQLRNDRKKEFKNNIQVCLDGPYGSKFFNNSNLLIDYQHIFMVAGGIGITPCHSILSGLINNEHIYSFYTMTFIWIVKNYKELYLCKNTFRSISSKGCNVLLYITEHGNLDKNGLEKLETDFVGCKISKNRPILKDVIVSELDTELDRFGVESNATNNKQLLYCCGPASLIQSCRNISHLFGMDFKDESFKF